MSPSPDPTARLRAWTHRRQRLGGAESDPAAALGAVIAVYSSHPTAPLSLLPRLQSLAADDFRALETERRAVRLPAMRGSVFLVPAETAPRVFAATREPLDRHVRKLPYAGVDREGYERLKEPLLEIAAEPRTSRELTRELRGAVDGLEDVKVSVVARIMAREGLILRLSPNLRTDRLRYVATEAWLGRPLDGEDPDAALDWLARTYLDRFGPARSADFAWWSGCTRGDAERCFEAADTVQVADGLHLPAELESAWRSVEPLDPRALDLLPKWDPYTMGHAPDGRGRLVDDRHLESAYTTRGSGSGATLGDGLPLVLAGGRAVASWRHRFEKDRMQVEGTPFDGEELPPGGLDAAFERAAGLLEADGVEVRRLPST